MKKVLLLLVLSVFTVNAQKFRGLDKSPMDVAAYPASHKNPNKIIKITYSRPQLKGRNIADLAPVEKVWRTGANEAVEVQFYKDVVFGGKKVKAGIYSLFTIPGKTEWTIILNKELNVWGAYSYKQEHDVLRVSAKVSENSENLEAFSMTFDQEMNLYMGWGTVLVTLPISK